MVARVSHSCLRCTHPLSPIGSDDFVCPYAYICFLPSEAPKGLLRCGNTTCSEVGERKAVTVLEGNRSQCNHRNQFCESEPVPPFLRWWNQPTHPPTHPTHELLHWNPAPPQSINPTQPNPTQPNPTQPNPTQPTPNQTKQKQPNLNQTKPTLPSPPPPSLCARGAAERFTGGGVGDDSPAG